MMSDIVDAMTYHNRARQYISTSAIIRLLVFLQLVTSQTMVEGGIQRHLSTTFTYPEFQSSSRTYRHNHSRASLHSSQTVSHRSSVDIDTEPVTLKYIEFGEGGSDTDENEPVFILHGLLGQKRNFASIATSLTKQLKKKRRIYAVDLRNHGDNSHDWRSDMSYTSMANDVLALMNELKISKATLIGHSMGGKVASVLALHNPERIGGLCIIDIAPVTYEGSDPAWKAVKYIIDTLSKIELLPGKTKKDIDKELSETVEDAALRAFVLTNLDVRSGNLQWKINIESISSELESIAGFDISVHEDKDMVYAGDTFFINGGSSSFVKASYMSTISKYFPTFMLTTVKQAGHWVHAERPTETIQLLKKYLDR